MKINNRATEIMENLNGLGATAGEMYTNQEIIDRLVELQSALARGVFEKTHAENLRDRDILIHFEALAKEYGLDSTDTYTRFKSNMQELGYTIGSFIKGKNGEKIAKRALKLLSYEKGIRILYNVQLEDEDAQAEYDAIVIAPYGLFVIEVKNWGVPMVLDSNGLLRRNDETGIVYDLPGRMSVKEALLREYLGDLFPSSHHNILLLPNEKAQIQDNYHQIIVSHGGGISYEIKAFGKQNQVPGDAQVDRIADIILNHHKEQKTVCPVNCEEIISDYAALMARIEAASSRVSDEPVQDGIIESQTVEIAAKQDLFGLVHCINWAKVGQIAASVAAVAAPIVITISKHKKF